MRRLGNPWLTMPGCEPISCLPRIHDFEIVRTEWPSGISRRRGLARLPNCYCVCTTLSTIPYLYRRLNSLSRPRKTYNACSRSQNGSFTWNLQTRDQTKCAPRYTSTAVPPLKSGAHVEKYPNSFVTARSRMRDDP